jgi:hypothetical protein
MTEANGYDALKTFEQATIEDITELAGRIRAEKSMEVVERVADDGLPPFDQKAHDLMIASVDKIAQQWISELNHVRDNTKVLEQMVIEQVTVVKNALTKLHLLGAQTMREAERGHEVVGQLGDELEAMMGQYATH